MCSYFVVKLPRYARVNTLKTEVIQVEEELSSCGYKLVCQSNFNLRHLASCGDSCTCSTFCKDEHVPNLLRFCPGASLTSTKLYASGHIIIQDKVLVRLYMYMYLYATLCEDTPIIYAYYRHLAFQLSFWHLHLAVMSLMLVLLLVIKALIWRA